MLASSRVKVMAALVDIRTRICRAPGFVVGQGNAGFLVETTFIAAVADAAQVQLRAAAAIAIAIFDRRAAAIAITVLHQKATADVGTVWW